MAKHLFLIHGRGFKPPEKILFRQWYDALRYGLAADWGEELAARLDEISCTSIYFGDISAAHLVAAGKEYDQLLDLHDRTKAIVDLKNYDRTLFDPPLAERMYEGLPGRTPVLEFLADTFGPLTAYLGIGASLIGLVAPDMEEYWNPDSRFGSLVRESLTVPLAEAFTRGDDIFLISHSLGAIVSYDVLWKFSYYSEYRSLREAGTRLSRWLTLGSPLGDETVKRHLKGAKASGARRFPDNIKHWVNIAAEDDYISYDQSIANDYNKMLSWDMVESIVDQRIFNLAVVGDRAKPHHAPGYLIHPAMSEQLAGWLRD